MRPNKGSRVVTTRRGFLANLAVASCAYACRRARAYADELSDVVVNRVISFEVPTRRQKFVGRNAYREPHGFTSTEQMLRVYGSNGKDGIGWSSVSREQASKLLGRRLAELVDLQHGKLVSPLGVQTTALWDLAGKSTGRPTFVLLGCAEDEVSVPVYDGSIYFQDLLPRYQSDWRSQFRRELDHGLDQGHRVFKMKVGRGDKWMSKKEGDRRDVEVCKLVLDHLGDDGHIAVDANNGSDIVRTKQFVEEFGPTDLLFVEEMFQDDVDKCLELKQFFSQRGIGTLVADGESRSTPNEFRPYVDAGALDLLQGDMNAFGIEGIREEARMAHVKGIRVAPHNWGSILGFFAQLHVGAATDNFYMAEQDPLHTPAIVVDGFELKNGRCHIPAKPGLGLRIAEQELAAVGRVRFDVRT